MAVSLLSSQRSRYASSQGLAEISLQALSMGMAEFALPAKGLRQAPSRYPRGCCGEIGPRYFGCFSFFDGLMRQNQKER